MTLQHNTSRMWSGLFKEARIDREKRDAYSHLFAKALTLQHLPGYRIFVNRQNELHPSNCNQLYTPDSISVFEDIRNQGLFLANYVYNCFPVVVQNIDKHSILP